MFSKDQGESEDIGDGLQNDLLISSSPSSFANEGAIILFLCRRLAWDKN